MCSILGVFHSSSGYLLGFYRLIHKISFLLRENIGKRYGFYWHGYLFWRKHFKRLQYAIYQTFIERKSHTYFNSRDREQLFTYEVMKESRNRYYLTEIIYYSMWRNLKNDFVNKLI